MMIVVLLVGLLFVFIAVKITTNNIKFSRHAITTTGEIVDFKVSEHTREDNDSDDSGTEISIGSSTTKMYAPVISYTTEDNETFLYESDTSSSHPSQSKGDKVEIAYLPSNPSDASLAGFSSRWISVIIMSILGTGLTFLGAADLIS